MDDTIKEIEEYINEMVIDPDIVDFEPFARLMKSEFRVRNVKELYDNYISRHRIEHDPRKKIPDKKKFIDDLQEKQLKDQEIKLILHERIQNNLPLEEYQQYLHLYNPLEFIKITGPVKKELKELAEPYRDLINELITENLQKLSMYALLNLFTKHTNNTNELNGIYG